MQLASEKADVYPDDVALCALFSLAAGVLLAALASIQPSWSASRMAPMEAMRVE